MAFAYERDVAVVDTNIARVYARLEGRRLTAKQVQAIADVAVPQGMGWAWNQCLMDLGATVCRPTPKCEDCPLRTGCAWRGEGDDPAIGSAGVSRAQGRFEGSERQARGRLMKALSTGAVRATDAPPLMRHAAAARLISDLLAEGLIATTDDVLHLP